MASDKTPAKLDARFWGLAVAMVATITLVGILAS
jgi:tetrahydromethanopterin S-methyltransferase subunit F